MRDRKQERRKSLPEMRLGIFHKTCLEAGLEMAYQDIGCHLCGPGYNLFPLDLMAEVN